MPDSFAYPIAATRPESGTPVTTSASTGYLRASAFPPSIRASYTLIPSIFESSLAK